MGFIAQYDSGTCIHCKEPIKAGEEIQDAPFGGQINRYSHVRCPVVVEAEAKIICSICGKQWIT